MQQPGTFVLRREQAVQLLARLFELEHLVDELRTRLAELDGPSRG